MIEQKGPSLGAFVRGVVDDEVVRVTALVNTGDAALVTFERATGQTESRFLSRDELALVTPAEQSVTLDASWSDFELGIQALAILAAPHESPLMAVSSSNVTPLPHQVQAVYDEMLPFEELRFLLADDPGAGKTIMTGLYLKEILARGRAARVLIVAPGSLVEQWVEEMWTRFGMVFTELLPEHLNLSDPTRPDVLAAGPLVVARLDQLARNKDLQNAVLASGFEVVVVDEAHKMSAREWGSKTIYSKRYLLGEELAAVCQHLLLLTATPHNGKTADFALFMKLLGHALDHSESVLDQMPVRRLVKEQLVKADGSRLFPPRVASTLTYTMTPPELELYEAVTTYVSESMNKVMDDTVRRSVGFAMMVLQRRLASSPEALLRSLERRLDKLTTQLQDAQDYEEQLESLLRASLEVGHDFIDDDPQDITDDASSTATAARTPAELTAEIIELEELVVLARSVRAAGLDRKWDALRDLLDSQEMFDGAGHRRKIIVFTEHRDTLDYLESRLAEVRKPGEYIAVISGKTSRWDRRQAREDFSHDHRCPVLLATDAAGEGVNLQVAHLMVNYDIPWNPNRLEQRFGRIHRIGQEHTCYLWNLVAADTREGDVFLTLLDKLDVQRQALGDRVFDVLGDVVSGADLSQILQQAIRGDDSGAGIATLAQRLEEGLTQEVARREASTTEFTPEDLEAIQRQLAWAKEFDPQTAVVPDFARRALRRFGAEVRELTESIWSVPYVPPLLAEHPGVEKSYPRLHLSRDSLQADEAGASQFLTPGHPLLMALTRQTLEGAKQSLKSGVVLVDPDSANDYALVTRMVEGRPLTERVGLDVVSREVAVNTVESLTPDDSGDHKWALTLLEALDVTTAVAVAAVRGTGSVERERTHLEKVEKAAVRLGQRGHVVRGRQGDAFDLAVEHGGVVEFVSMDRSGAPTAR